MGRTLGALRLREWRTRNRLTQVQVSAMVGVDFMRISKWERGVGRPGRTPAGVLERVTGGEVSVESWDVPAPEALEEAA